MPVISAETAYQYAIAHRQAGRLTEAEQLLRQILAAQPGHLQALHQLGLILLTTGRSRDALEVLTRVISMEPGNAHCHSDLGVALSYLGRSEEAVASFQRALQLRPDLGHTRRNLGDVLYGMGRFEEAILSYQSALAVDPKDANAHNNLGSVLQRIGRLAEASACYARAAQLDPTLLEARSNYGDTLTKLGRLDEGLACCRQVLAMNPQFPDGYLNMGVTWCLKGCYAEAEASYRRAIALRPDFANAHINLGLLLLLLGRYEEGWREYEWRWNSPHHAHRKRGFSAPTWDGTPTPGRRILIHAEQGFGDTLLFTRYLPLVVARSQASRVILECQPALLPLLNQLSNEKIEVVARCETVEGLPPFDLQLPLFSMPLALETFSPLPPLLLRADAALRSAWRARLGNNSQRLVGIAWSGNPEQAEDRRRSIAPEKLAPILKVRGIQLVSLQVEPRGPLPAPLAERNTLHVSHWISDFSDSAALMAELDLIITVDTAAAHLAGTLGCPAWVLSPFMPYWPYGHSGEATPWYPTMRVFRQSAPENWDHAIESLADELRKWIGQSLTG